MDMPYALEFFSWFALWKVEPVGGRRFLGFDVRNSVFYKFFYISLEGKQATDLYTMGSLISTVKHDI